MMAAEAQTSGRRASLGDQGVARRVEDADPTILEQVEGCLANSLSEAWRELGNSTVNCVTQRRIVKQTPFR